MPEQGRSLNVKRLLIEVFLTGGANFSAGWLSKRNGVSGIEWNIWVELGLFLRRFKGRRRRTSVLSGWVDLLFG